MADINGITVLNTEIITEPNQILLTIGAAFLIVFPGLMILSIILYYKDWSETTSILSFAVGIAGIVIMIIGFCNQRQSGVKYYTTIDNSITLEEFQNIENKYEIVDKQGDIYVFFEETE